MSTFFAEKFINLDFFFLLKSVDEDLDSVPAPTHTFLGCLFFWVQFLNAALVLAYFDFKG